MKDFFKKIKLIRNFSLKIPLEKSDFIFVIRKNVDVEINTFLAPIIEIFSPSKNKYVGEIDHKGFKIRKRKKFFSTSKNSSMVNGVFRQKDNVLYLETEVKGFTLTGMTLYICVVLFCLYFVGFELIEKSGKTYISIIPVLLFQSLLLFGVPYLVIKSRIKRMQLDLEADIFDWIIKW